MQLLFDMQREIHAQISTNIKQLSSGRDWLLLLSMLPMGILFGAVHALTPGHSKAVLATYVAGSPVGLLKALFVSLSLSFTHVTMAVLIALFSLPLVSVALGSAGQAPALETISRGLLILVGFWMVWRAVRHAPHRSHEGEAVGFVAGLIPCPLTLFVMMLALARGVPEAGLAFAAAMMLGVALTLSAVALAAAAFRLQLTRLLETRPALMHGISRTIEAVGGAVLIAIAIHEILR